MRNTTVIVAVALLSSAAAHAELADVVNDIRAAGCTSNAQRTTRVERDVALDAAAKRIAFGGELDAALASAGYRAASATVINIGGASGDAAIREVLADGFCDKVNNAAYAALGTHVLGNEFWLVLAAPWADAPDEGDSVAMAQRVLELVNEARREDRRCGRQRLRAAGALTMSASLTRAAAAHAADMAAHEFVGHGGSDGSEAGVRVSRAGYSWRSIGENVAAGQLDAETVVHAWLDSPGHCANIMAPQFTEMGVAFVAVPQSDLRIVWAQVFATPK
jgi:uncharacterized protein YkwD